MKCLLENSCPATVEAVAQCHASTLVSNYLAVSPANSQLNYTSCP